MTITTETAQITVAANGSATSFSYPFLIPSKTRAKLYLTTPNGTVTLVPQSSWTLQNANNPSGGTFGYTTGNGPAPAGSLLTLVRNEPYTQTTNLRSQGPYSPAVVEAALDALAMQTQQLAGLYDTTLRTGYGDPIGPLPSRSQRANKMLGFDASGNPVSAQLNATSGIPTSVYMAGLLMQGSAVDALAFLGMEQYVNVKNYGAVGDGATNDTPAFQAAANTGKSIYVPQAPVSYALHGSVYLNSNGQHVWGDGRRSVIKPIGTVNCFVWANDTRGGGGRDLTFNNDVNNPHSGGALFYVSTAHRLNFERILCQGIWNCVYVERSNWCRISGFYADQIRGDIAFHWYGTPALRSDILYLEHCTVSYAAEANQRGHGLVWDGNCNSLYINNFGVVRPRHGILIRNTAGGTGSQAPLISRCFDIEIDYPYDHGICINGLSYDHDFIGAYVQGSTIGSGIWISSASPGGQIRILGGKCSGNARYGIETASFQVADNVYYGGNNGLGQRSGTLISSAPRFEVDSKDPTKSTSGFYMTVDANDNPQLIFDANDSMQFSRSSNTWFVSSDGRTLVAAAPTFLQVGNSFLASNPLDAVNGVQTTGAAAGQQVRIFPVGADGNIDMELGPKGSNGRLNFRCGTTGVAGGQSGWMQVKVNGTDQKIPIYNV